MTPEMEPRDWYPILGLLFYALFALAALALAKLGRSRRTDVWAERLALGAVIFLLSGAMLWVFADA